MAFTLMSLFGNVFRSASTPKLVLVWLQYSFSFSMPSDRRRTNRLVAAVGRLDAVMNTFSALARPSPIEVRLDVVIPVIPYLRTVRTRRVEYVSALIPVYFNGFAIDMGESG